MSRSPPPFPIQTLACSPACPLALGQTTHPLALMVLLAAGPADLREEDLVELAGLLPSLCWRLRAPDQDEVEVLLSIYKQP